MTNETHEQPQHGGSYIRDKDGKLTRVAADEAPQPGAMALGMAVEMTKQAAAGEKNKATAKGK